MSYSAYLQDMLRLVAEHLGTPKSGLYVILSYSFSVVVRSSREVDSLLHCTICRNASCRDHWIRSRNASLCFKSYYRIPSVLRWPFQYFKSISHEHSTKNLEPLQISIFSKPFVVKCCFCAQLYYSSHHLNCNKLSENIFVNTYLEHNVHITIQP